MRILPALAACSLLLTTGASCHAPRAAGNWKPDALGWLRGTFHDFGLLPQDTTATIHFPYRNTGTAPLQIETIRTDCGCTVPAWPLKPLPPGGTDSIQVAFDASGRGRFEKHLRIFFLGMPRPYKLTIAGEVGPP
ncbi:MAG: hypothetical protein RLY31_1095 [Bacteroidota bacterium]|jgi:hypothetical protein